MPNYVSYTGRLNEEKHNIQTLPTLLISIKLVTILTKVSILGAIYLQSQTGAIFFWYFISKYSGFASTSLSSNLAFTYVLSLAFKNKKKKKHLQIRKQKYQQLINLLRFKTTAGSSMNRLQAKS